MNRKLNRQPMSIYQITDYITDGKTEKEKAALPRDFFHYRPELYKQLIIPSFVHGYSLCIEYMRNWFLNKFEKRVRSDGTREEYFKSVNVNGRHVLDEWKHFNKQNIKREMPMLAIIPTVDYEHDREYQDAYLADRRLLLHKSDYQQSFFKDWDNMLFLYAQPKEMKMNFTFKVRVSSKAEQQDLLQKMELYFRVGASETEHISADIHIPYDIMVCLAKANGFEVDKSNTIVDPFSFVSYCNKHSDMPIIYKMRAINQKAEFFMRASNLRVHIICRDKIQPDDGEKEGRLDTNYHLELQTVVYMIVPHFFVFFNQKPIEHEITVGHEAVGIYTINCFEVPPCNSRGWNQKAQTNYLCDKGERFIDLSSIFEGKAPMCETMRYNLENFINPDSFIEVVVYRARQAPILMSGWVDYRHLRYVFDDEIEKEEMMLIVVYADDGYINNTMINIKNYNSTRIDKPSL